MYKLRSDWFNTGYAIMGMKDGKIYTILDAHELSEITGLSGKEVYAAIESGEEVNGWTFDVEPIEWTK